MTDKCPLCSSATFANGDCVAMHKHGLLTAHVVVLPERLEEYYKKQSEKWNASIGELITEDLIKLYEKERMGL